jgi:tetratricopeptide (TPR) repeat protein
MKLESVLRRVFFDEPTRLSRRLARLTESEAAEVAEFRCLSPGALRRRLEGDLDWISDRALAKDRDARYGSVTELASDIENHLAHRPIQASPPSRFYTLRKFARRQRALVATVLLLLLTLAGGVVARTFEARRANEAAASALQALEETEQVSQFLIDLFRDSDPWSRSAQEAAKETTVREILDRGAEKIRSEFADQPKARARFMATIGSVYLNLGMFAEAEPLLQESVSLRRPFSDTDPLELAETHHLLGDLYWRTGRPAKAEPYFHRAWTMREKELGPKNLLVAESLEGLARSLREQGRNQEALPLMERAVEIRQESDGSDTALPGTLSALAEVYGNLGQTVEAERLLRLSLELAEQRLAAESPDLGLYSGSLGRFYFRHGRLDEAEPLFLRSLAICRTNFSDDHLLVGLAQTHLGLLYEAQGRGAEAEPLLRGGLEIAVAIYGPESDKLNESKAALARIAAATGRSRAATGPRIADSPGIPDP